VFSAGFTAGATIGAATACTFGALASHRIDKRCGTAGFDASVGCHAKATQAACAATMPTTITP